MVYKLYYWPIQGRGEFIRLAFEEAAVPYEDVARTGEGMAEMIALMQNGAEVHQPFAPPFLNDGDALIGQTAAILFYLGPKLGPRAMAQALPDYPLVTAVRRSVGQHPESKLIL